MDRQKSTVDLNRQLEAYAAVAKLPEHQARKRWGNWAIYAAATGAALASASAASAEIIYSGPQNITLPLTFTANQVRFNYAGGLTRNLAAHVKNNIFRLYARKSIDPMRFFSFPGHYTAMASARLNGKAGRFGTGDGRFFTTSGGNAKFFAEGARISGAHQGPGALLFSSFLNGHGCGTGSPAFPACNSITSGHRGRFKTGATSLGGRILGMEFQGGDEGWIRVAFGGSFRSYEGKVFNPTSMTVVDWAYNTNGSILAGQTSSPVPEPSTAPVMLLAAGAAGVLAWKRRRKEQTPTA
jgi:hypothetical protein